MKKLIHLISIFVCIEFYFSGLVPQTAASQPTQLRNWYIGPAMIDMSNTTPVPKPIPTSQTGISPATAAHTANGMYDSYNQLLFYIADNGVYDANNQLIGTIQNSGGEVAIVPFGDNDPALSKKKYNVFTTAGGFSGSVGLVRTVVDMWPCPPTISSTQIDGMTFANEFGAIAVGTVQSISNDRYLYYLAGTGTVGLPGGGEIHKLIIHQDGSVTGSSASPPLSPTYLLYPPNPPTYPNGGAKIFAREMDLSPDGSWLAWASYAAEHTVDQQGAAYPTQNRYHFMHLDTKGDYDPSIPYTEFNLLLPGGATTDNYLKTGFRGVEFYQFGIAPNIQTKLCIGTGDDGIYIADIPNWSSQHFVTNSDVGNGNYGYSQIEFAQNRYMYASAAYNTLSPGPTSIGAFDLSIIPLSILPLNSFPLGSATVPSPSAVYALPAIPPNPVSNLYTLPDQIDGEDYAATLSDPGLIPVDPSGIYDYHTGTINTWDGATNTSAANPWGITTTNPADVQVNNKLIISGNSQLIIKNMKFRFSKDAKVIIEAGSSLTLDNTTFTSDYKHEFCIYTKSWIGVEVRGNNTGSQFTVTDEGKLTLKNSSVIEYAQWGARAINANGTSSGGIIIANNSSFNSNNVDVEFTPYQNFRDINGNHILYGNRSYFSNANFTTDQFYPFTTAPIM